MFKPNRKMYWAVLLLFLICNPGHGYAARHESGRSDPPHIEQDIRVVTPSTFSEIGASGASVVSEDYWHNPRPMWPNPFTVTVFS
jgi:hypothetical protein